MPEPTSKSVGASIGLYVEPKPRRNPSLKVLIKIGTFVQDSSLVIAFA